VGGAAYAEYVAFYESDRWQALAAKGAKPQRLLFASTGTKDPTASKTLYIEGLAAPDTVNTMPEDTLLALAEADVSIRALPTDGDAARAELARFEEAGISIDGLGLELQQKGAESFVKSWESLMTRVTEKARAVASA
jgi:transaldolase